MSALRKLGLVAAAGAMAAGISVTTVGTADAATTLWYKTDAQCNRAGGNFVNQGGYSDFRCSYVASHHPHWRLRLT